MTDSNKSADARIQELEKALEEAGQRTRQLEFLLDKMPHFISFLTVDRRFRFTNARLSDWFDGTERSSAHGALLNDVVGKEAGALVEASFQEVEETEEEVNYLGPMKYKDSIAQMEVSYHPHFRDGEIDGFGVIVEDLTERLAEEQKLQQAAAVFEAVGEGILLLNAKHEIVRVNKAFTELSGYSEEETIGKRPANLKAPGRQEGILDLIWEAMRKEGFWQGEVIQRRKDGSIGGAWVTVNTIADRTGYIHHYVAIISDLEASSSLSHQAHHDILTGLPNRLLLDARLEHTLERAHRLGEQAAVLFMDLDGFKTINDAEGHTKGDAVLVEVARRLKQALRSIDTVSRLGGDEFVVILDHVHEPIEATDVADRLLAIFDKPFLAGENSYTLSTSIGLSLYPAQARTGAELIHFADLAMYAAKASGKGCHRLYDPSMNSKEPGR